MRSLNRAGERWIVRRVHADSTPTQTPHVHMLTPVHTAGEAETTKGLGQELRITVRRRVRLSYYLGAPI